MCIRDRKSTLREKRDTIVKALRDRLGNDAPSFVNFNQGDVYKRQMLDSSTPVEITPETPALDSSTAPVKVKKPTTLDSSAHKAAVTELAVALIRPSPFQVRAVADSDYIETLMASIVQSGVILSLIHI